MRTVVILKATSLAFSNPPGAGVVGGPLVRLWFAAEDRILVVADGQRVNSGYLEVLTPDSVDVFGSMKGRLVEAGVIPRSRRRPRRQIRFA